MMGSNNNYANMTPEGVALAEKKIKSQKIISAVFIGVLLGIAVWAATHGSPILTAILLVAALVIGRKTSQNLKSLQAEIDRKAD